MSAHAQAPPVTAPDFPTEGPGAGTLPGLLRVRAAADPARVAMRQKSTGIWKSITWQEYLDRVIAVALGLEELGIGKGDRVGIVADNEPDWMVADLAAQCLGAWSVAVYPMQVRSEVGFILADSSCRVVFCGDQEQTDKVIDERADGNLPAMEHLVVFDMLGVDAYDDPSITAFEALAQRGGEIASGRPHVMEEWLAQLDPDDVAFVGYTSGTTGKPKGALLTHRNQVTMASVMSTWIGMGPSDRILCHFPLPHPAVRVTDAYTSLWSGASLDFPESDETMARDMFEVAPTVILGTPRVFEVMKAEVETRMQRAAPIKRAIYGWSMRTLRRNLDRELSGGRANPVSRTVAYWAAGRWVRDKLGLLQLRFASCGGASVSTELLSFFWAMGVPIRETYGQSETSGVAFSQWSMADRGTAGWVLPTLEARIDENRELLVRGDGIFVGYLGRPDQTEAALVDGEWYRTGDIARFDDAGRLVILDREKHVIHTADGHDLSPSEIENTLKLSPYIGDAMVVGEDRPFVSALVQIEYETVADWAQRNNLAYTTYKSLTEHPEVQTLVGRAIDDANGLLPDDRQVRDHRLFPRELDSDLDEVTPTRKIKRNVVMERFGELVDEMYATSPSSTGA